MKALLPILFLLLLFPAINHAQLSFVWAGRMGGNTITSAPSDVGRSIALDKNGNVYTTGNFYGAADFDPGNVTQSLTSAGASDVFVSKLDNNGKYVWAKKFGGSNYNDGNDITIDKNGNIYIIGSFQSATDFDPGPGVQTLTPLGYKDVFVCKLDSNGTYIWAKQFGGAVISTDQCDGYGIAVDDNGNVYTTGAILYGKADFDPGPGDATLISAGEFDIFICKLNSNGDYVWAKSMGSTWRDAGNKIAVDSKGYVYLAGYFSGTVDFDPGPGVTNLSTPLYTNDAFICRFDSTGVLSWAHQIGAPGGDDEAEDIAVDAIGNVYTTGKFYYGGVDFNPGADTFTMNTIGSSDVFICKWDSAAKFCWAKHIGGSSVTINSYSIALANNFVCITGNFGGRAGWPVDFDPGAGVYNMYSNPGTNNTSVNIFVEQLDTAGQFMNAARMGGPTGIVTNTGFGIAADSNGNVYTTGQYVSTADFDPDTIGTYYLTTTNALDDEEIFVSKLHSNIAAPVLPMAGFNASDTAFCGNACINFTNTSANAISYQWIFNGATPATDTSKNPTNICYTVPGVYNVTLIAINADGTDTLKKSQYITSYLPIVPIVTIPGSDTVFCSGDSVQLCTSGAFRSLQWNTSDTSACTYAKAAGGYWVNTVDSNGCTAQSAHLPLSTYPVPTISIVVNGDTLRSFNALTYQWNKNNEPIPGATGNFYVVTVCGNYSLQITDANGCAATSQNIPGDCATGINELPASAIKLYPNPSYSKWQLVLDKNMLDASLTVYDMQGKLVLQSVVTNLYTEIELDGTSGVYFLQLHTGENVYNAKLVKQ